MSLRVVAHNFPAALPPAQILQAAMRQVPVRRVQIASPVMTLPSVLQVLPLTARGESGRGCSILRPRWRLICCNSPVLLPERFGLLRPIAPVRNFAAQQALPRQGRPAWPVPPPQPALCPLSPLPVQTFQPMQASTTALHPPAHRASVSATCVSLRCEAIATWHPI